MVMIFDHLKKAHEEMLNALKLTEGAVSGVKTKDRELIYDIIAKIETCCEKFDKGK